jgi:hypothetical protein
MSHKDPIVTQVLSLILNDQALSNPVYIQDLQSAVDAEQQASLPLIYIWNEDRTCGSFTLSVNGTAVGSLLEVFCDRRDPKFVVRRDEIMKVLSTLSQQSVMNLCSKLSCMPSDIFSP